MGIVEPELLACVQALIICGWKDRDGIEGFIMLREEGGGRRRAERGSNQGKKRKKPQEGRETASEKEADARRREGERERERERCGERAEGEKGARRRPRRG